MAEFLFMIQLVHLPPSAHTITFSAHCSKSPVHTHCSSHYIFSAHCSKSPVHTHCSSYYIFSAHCSCIIQCTLQQIFSALPVHTLQQLLHLQCTLQQISSAHTLQQPLHLQCTLQLHYLVPILYSTFSAPLNHHRVSLYHCWPTSRTVSRH